MIAKELIKRYKTEKHPENGYFIERHYNNTSNQRAESGCIYYYIEPGEKTQFHRIDCDEYWSHNSGCAVEIWRIRNGCLTKELCGTDGNSEPTVYFKKGDIFASCLSKNAVDGAFITCITVPRFCYDGFEILDKKDVVELCKEAEEFFY